MLRSLQKRLNRWWAAAPASSADDGETLRLIEERFQLLVESIQDYAIYILDPNGFVTSWNTGAQRIKGYSAQEILGKHFSRFYTPDDVRVNKPRRNLEIAAAKGRYEDEPAFTKRWFNLLGKCGHHGDSR